MPYLAIKSRPGVEGEVGFISRGNVRDSCGSSHCLSDIY